MQSAPMQSAPRMGEGRRIHVWPRRAALLCGGMLCLSVGATADHSRAQLPAPEVVAAPADSSGFLGVLLREVKPSFDLRLRSEFADQKGRDEGIAYTARARLGLTSRERAGFQVFAELEHNEVFGRRRFDAAGVHGNPTKGTIADPESTELNQAYLTYTHPRAQLKIGRQNIRLGEGVFVGDIGFRQNGQTFDALTVTSKPTESLELFYSYVYNINRLFGSSEGRSLNSNSRSHLIQATYQVSDVLRARLFGYLFDLQSNGADAGSTNTGGISFTGGRDLGGWQLGYRAEFAVQTDAARSERDYRAHFLHASGSVARGGVKLGVGRERFGADDGIGFANTLDTTFRDLFITSPPDGLRDDFLQLGVDLPLALKAEVQYHRFASAAGSRDYGQQVQWTLRRELASYASLFIRAFKYRDDEAGPGGSALPPDTFRYSVQIDFRFD
jgi:hypothetical protein